MPRPHSTHEIRTEGWGLAVCPAELGPAVARIPGRWNGVLQECWLRLPWRVTVLDFSWGSGWELHWAVRVHVCAHVCVCVHAHACTPMAHVGSTGVPCVNTHLSSGCALCDCVFTPLLRHPEGGIPHITSRALAKQGQQNERTHG